MLRKIAPLALIGLVAASSCASAVVALALGGLEASPPNAETRSKSGAVVRIIDDGIRRFIEAEERYPNDFQELCSSPYIVIRCTDLKNPYTSSPVEDGIKIPGNIALRSENGDLVLLTFVQGAEGLSEREQSYARALKVAVVINQQPALKAQKAQRAKMSSSEKSAVTVGEYLYRFIMYQDPREWAPKGEPTVFVPPASWNEALERNARREVPWKVDGLRNEFARGYARLTDTPSAGNFRYYRVDNLPGPAPWSAMLVEVYGADSKPVYSIRIGFPPRGLAPPAPQFERGPGTKPLLP